MGTSLTDRPAHCCPQIEPLTPDVAALVEQAGYDMAVSGLASLPLNETRVRFHRAFHRARAKGHHRTQGHPICCQALSHGRHTAVRGQGELVTWR